MAIPIRLKQSTVTAVPPSLGIGEPAVYITGSDATLFIGDSGGVPRRVAGSNIFLPLTGGTITGPLVLAADPVVALGATTKQYTDTQVATRLTQAQGDARYLRLTGGTITGPLVLAADPVVALGATTKQYTDTQVATRLTQAQGDARYAALVHTHVESQITNLDRTRFRGAWSAGSYILNDMVTYLGKTYVANANTTQTPGIGAQWTLIATAGAATTASDTAPSSPSPGDLWYRTLAPVGLFMWFTDADSSQWISTDQASAYYSNMLQLLGGTMTGQLVINPNPSIAVGLAMQGTYSTAAITIPSGQSIALDDTGVVRMRYNSGSNVIEFIRAGVVKQTLNMA